MDFTELNSLPVNFFDTKQIIDQFNTDLTKEICDAELEYVESIEGVVSYYVNYVPLVSNVGHLIAKSS